MQLDSLSYEMQNICVTTSNLGPIHAARECVPLVLRRTMTGPQLLGNACQ